MPLSLTSRPRVVLFGDSLTQRGFEEQGWASALCDYYTRRADVLNRGYGGWNSRWARFVAADLLAPAAPRDGAKPHHVVAVWFGANDAAAPTERAHVPLAEYGQNLDGQDASTSPSVTSCTTAPRQIAKDALGLQNFQVSQVLSYPGPHGERTMHCAHGGTTY